MKTLTIEDIYKDVKNEVRSHYGFHAYTSEVADKLKWHESHGYNIANLDNAFIEIEVLERDKFLELLKGIIDNATQVEENKITLQSVRDEISKGLFHRFRFVFNTIGMPLDDMSILRNLENAEVSIISGEKMSIETKDNVKVLDEIDKAINDRKRVADPINPTHYNGTQTLDRMIAVFGVDAVISFCEINAFEYRMMAGKKGGNPIEQDIKKALWYEGKANELKRNDNDG